jgi:hypothetical protein
LIVAALKYLPELLNQVGISEVVNVVQEPVDKVIKKAFMNNCYLPLRFNIT